MWEFSANNVKQFKSMNILGNSDTKIHREHNVQCNVCTGPLVECPQHCHTKGKNVQCRRYSRIWPKIQ